jgi:hypothetical protein
MAAHARIFRPTRTPTQQGGARTQEWVLEFLPAHRRFHEPLMGWVASNDTRPQVKLRFPTREEAVAYAEQNGIAFEVEEPNDKLIRPKSYAANFAWNRIR